jgi:flavin reductase (DIM6/NTAB) family NADH-FMN oxidoreductase RutF
MTKHFFTSEQIWCGIPELPDPQFLFYTVRGPVPACLVVWQHPVTRQPLLRLATMNPVSWRPFAMTVSFSRDDRQMTETLREGDPVIMAWGGANLVRSSYLVSLDLPPNVDYFRIARLTPVTSPYGPVPHVAECPLNHECTVGRIVDYHDTRVYFLHVEYASLDEEILPLAREEVITRYHLWEVDRVRNDFGGELTRFGMVGEIQQCPTFPVNGKVGWCNSFVTWMRDLRDEGYLSDDEFRTIIAWNDRWLDLFEDLESPERQQLRKRLTRICQKVAWQEWDDLHTFLDGEGAASLP